MNDAREFLTRACGYLQAACDMMAIDYPMIVWRDGAAWVNAVCQFPYDAHGKCSGIELHSIHSIERNVRRVDVFVDQEIGG